MLFKIPPTVNVVSFLFAIYQAPGAVPDFLGWFHSNTSPHTVPCFLLTVSCYAYPPFAASLVLGSALQRRLADITARKLQLCSLFLPPDRNMDEHTAASAFLCLDILFPCS